MMNINHMKNRTWRNKCKFQSNFINLGKIKPIMSLHEAMLKLQAETKRTWQNMHINNK